MAGCVWKVEEKDRLCSLCNVPNCEFRPTSRRGGNIMGIMKRMAVGTWCFFPIGRWNAVRSSASELKRQWGAIFETRRVGNEIRVKRNF
jgi:hypothetical protein